MQQFKEGAEIVEGRMTFIQEFLQKKYGFGILIFVIIIGGAVTAWAFFNKGIENGEKSSKQEIKSLNISLKNVRYNDSLEISTLNNRVSFYKKSLDTCNNNSMSGNLEKQISQKLEEAERIKRLLERKIKNDEKDIKIIDKIIKT